MPTRPNPGRALATRQAVVDLIRTATLGSYGVTGFSASGPSRLLGRLGLAQPGITVRLGPVVDIGLDLSVAPGVPIAEVARQVDSAVRYTLHAALGRDVRRLTIHVNGLRTGAEARPTSLDHAPDPGVTPDALADSGMDVA